jgi:hypothetical protein
MKTLVTLALTAAFLSAGAFAKRPASVPVQLVNVTVIAKNQVWPIKLHKGFTGCDERRCIDI